MQDKFVYGENCVGWSAIWSVWNSSSEKWERHYMRAPNFEDIWAEILGAFSLDLKRGPVTSVLSARQSACISWGPRWTDLYEIWHWGVCMKSVETIQIWSVWNSSSEKSERRYMRAQSFEDIWAEILGAFSLDLKRGPVTSVISARQSACISWGPRWTDLYEIWHWGACMKSVETIQIWSKSGLTPSSEHKMLNLRFSDILVLMNRRDSTWRWQSFIYLQIPLSLMFEPLR